MSVSATGPSLDTSEDMRARIQDLLGPDRSLIETHISWVVIGPRDVYKLKKPVDFGFLDFTTLELRKDACEAEVELNRRLAPDVYRGVLPVTRDAGGRWVLGGEGEPVQWAVHMRRLPDADRADIRLRQGRLQAEDIERIALRLARFHEQARCDEHTASFGSRQAIEANVRENFAQTEDSITQHVTSDEAAEIEDWQLRFLEDNAALLEDRAAQGRVRDGHGDLRLEHVYIDEQGEIVIIDCIEFNERFRFADVASDLAFLAMDLSEHDHPALAERLVAAYARASNDYDLYSVLDFYQSYRAFVRAKVASLLAEDPGVDERTGRRASEQARRHYLLALASERRSVLPPMLIAVGGVIASGKSTVADRLAAQMGAPVVDADRTRKSMLGVAATQRVDSDAWTGAYDPAFTETVYEEVLRRAAVVLRSGRPVVVDASFRSRSFRARARAVAARAGVPFRFVECRVEPAVAKERLRERAKTASVSDGRLEIFDDFVAKWEPVLELPAGEHVLLDTQRPVEQSMQTLRELVPTWPQD